jgi:hypothetical protein
MQTLKNIKLMITFYSKTCSEKLLFITFLYFRSLPLEVDFLILLNQRI